jgi:hypothetical protein
MSKIKINNIIPFIANSLWESMTVPEYNRFKKATIFNEESQKKYLFSLLEKNAETLFGKKYNFNKIKSIDDYQKYVPLSGYEDYKKYIGLISKGDKNVLTADDVFLFEPSSGSTSARKLIPYNCELKKEFQMAVSVWMASLFKKYPKIKKGKAYWSISPTFQKNEFYGIIPVGFDSDTEYLGFAAKLLSKIITIKPDLSDCKNYNDFKIKTLIDLLATRDLSLISVWSPTFLIILLDYYLNNREQVLNLMLKNDKFVPRANLIKKYENKKDAFEKIWPDLALISCWKDGASKSYAEKLRKYFPNTPIQGKGLLATECFVTFPYEVNKDPVLAISSHFFEFMDENGECLTAYQVEKRGCYSVVVTTGGGLYRYKLEDRILVTGFINKTPTLKFIGKANNVSDQFGEKLNEIHIAKIIKSVLSNEKYNFCILAPDNDDTQYGYTLYIENKDNLSEGLAENFEKGLCENPHYKYCIELGQLRPIKIFRIVHNGYNTYKMRLSELGMKYGDIKISYLNSLDNWSDYFQGEYK